MTRGVWVLVKEAQHLYGYRSERNTIQNTKCKIHPRRPSIRDLELNNRAVFSVKLHAPMDGCLRLKSFPCWQSGYSTLNSKGRCTELNKSKGNHPKRQIFPAAYSAAQAENILKESGRGIGRFLQWGGFGVERSRISLRVGGREVDTRE